MLLMGNRFNEIHYKESRDISWAFQAHFGRSSGPTTDFPACGVTLMNREQILNFNCFNLDVHVLTSKHHELLNT